MIDGYEPDRGTRVAGHRGYFLKGNAVLLNQAIILYAMQWNIKRGFTTLPDPILYEQGCDGWRSAAGGFR